MCKVLVLTDLCLAVVTKETDYQCGQFINLKNLLSSISLHEPLYQLFQYILLKSLDHTVIPHNLLLQKRRKLFANKHNRVPNLLNIPLHGYTFPLIVPHYDLKALRKLLLVDGLFREAFQKVVQAGRERIKRINLHASQDEQRLVTELRLQGEIGYQSL